MIYLIQFHAGQMEVQISVTPLISKPDGFNSKVCVQNTSTLSRKTQNTHFAKQRTLFWHTKSCNRRGKGAFFFFFPRFTRRRAYSRVATIPTWPVTPLDVEVTFLIKSKGAGAHLCYVTFFQKNRGIFFYTAKRFQQTIFVFVGELDFRCFWQALSK